MRGPKQHQKRIAAPKCWNLSKMSGIFAVKALPGPHKANESLPLAYLVKNKLKLAESMREAKIIIQQGNILVNGKVRTLHQYPVGQMDVVSIPATHKDYRLIFSSFGYFELVETFYNPAEYTNPLPSDLLKDSTLKINPVKVDSSKLKLQSSTDKDGVRTIYIPCRVKDTGVGNKKMVGTNPAATNPNEKSIPWLTTDCGKVFRYVDRKIKIGDTVLVKITSTPIKTADSRTKLAYKAESEIADHWPLKIGHTAIVMRGKNIGRVGKIEMIEKHKYMSDVFYFKDEKGHTFVTKNENVLVIGTDHPYIGLGKDRGVKLTLEESVKWNIQCHDNPIAANN